MINAGIIGATGYAGQELIRLLYTHPDVNIVYLSSHSYAGKKLSEVYPNFTGLLDMELVSMDAKKMADDCDVIFFALPHGLTADQISEDILNKVKIIDLGADFRLKDKEVYENWYKVEHSRPHFLEESVYGLCELNREKIKKARLVANPGCYTTCSITSLAPLVTGNLIDLSSIIIDAKSGISGAGRSINLPTHFTESNESFKAYGVGTHRHTPEIEQELSRIAGKNIVLSFTPHLIPMNRGILITAYASLSEKTNSEKLLKIYNDFYKNEKFIRMFPAENLPETRFVRNSNFVDIGLKIDPRTNRVIVVGAIDNLIKGAAGQAVQNMNIMFGISEDSGLDIVPTVI
ncbi:MAG: N-acetyl-gamma-glutamyl-phosphate reductase [Spirochaetia bacterium]|jgi:N-acetyl-gamma-glutamyl-phosphate reductase|nr:N-acetyl-gamma-glutamyl-phosphate reductase [Spirochaetia bacterium]